MTLNNTGCTWYRPDRQPSGENPALNCLKISIILLFGSFPLHHILSDQGAKSCVRSLHLSLRFGQLCWTDPLRNPLWNHWVQLQLSRYTGNSSQIWLWYDKSMICLLFQGIVLVVAVCNMAAYITVTKRRNAEVEGVLNQTWTLNNVFLISSVIWPFFP